MYTWVFSTEFILLTFLFFLSEWLGVKVTVTIPTLNEENFLSDCLDDISKCIEFAMQDGFEFEVTVIDSHSDDDTVEIARKSDVVDEIYTEGKGILRARDRGIREAGGEIVVCLDADTHYEEEYLSELLKPFRENGEVSLSYGPAKGERTELHLDSSIRYILENGLRMLGLCWVSGSNRAMRKTDYLELGGYDLSRDGESVLKVMYEEQFRFPLELKKMNGISFRRGAESFQSHRTVDQLLLLDRKEGGADWKIIKPLKQVRDLLARYSSALK